jgi:UDPglucose 6-dehydrogenase
LTSVYDDIEVRVHDPLVSEDNFKTEMEVQGFNINNDKVKFFGTDYKSACEGASAIVIMTEFDEFKEYNYQNLHYHMNQFKKTFFYDLRSYLDVDTLKDAGF